MPDFCARSTHMINRIVDLERELHEKQCELRDEFGMEVNVEFIEHLHHTSESGQRHVLTDLVIVSNVNVTVPWDQ